ncbi:YcxB family protein [Chamaesiphon sp. VAR_69_metabat_338]|uniref:YcxB family protein n=1 Tax=Chamaesiphon sp. VAR_69_metabat_338 TaxID=2964704 RepID=UPI00286E76AF|nr:YcxB family protein [Chamaesiphon sp. VAR_69_metabat_338]
MQNIKLEYRLKLAELIESDPSRNRPESVFYLIIFDGILVALYLTSARSSQGEIYFQAMLVPTLLFYFSAITCSILIFYLSRLSRYFTIKKDWQQRMQSGQTCGLEIDDRGFTDNAVPPAIFSWSMCDYWRETSNLFLIYDAAGSCILFPKRVFGNEQIQDFRQVLTNNLIYRKKPKIRWK